MGPVIFLAVVGLAIFIDGILFAANGLVLAGVLVMVLGLGLISFGRIVLIALKQQPVLELNSSKAPKKQKRLPKKREEKSKAVIEEPVDAPVDSLKASTVERMKKLNKLKEEGLISQSEYDVKREEILSDI